MPALSAVGYKTFAGESYHLQKKKKQCHSKVISNTLNYSSKKLTLVLISVPLSSSSRTSAGKTFFLFSHSFLWPAFPQWRYKTVAGISYHLQKQKYHSKKYSLLEVKRPQSTAKPQRRNPLNQAHTW